MAGNGLTQTGFRGREDDGSETAATWLATVNTNWEQRPSINFRVRLLVEHDIVSPWGGSLRIFCSLNSDTVFTEVNEESRVVRGAPTVHYTSGDDSTQQIGAGVFLVDNNGMAETDAISGYMEFGLAENEEVEVEYCLQIVAGDVKDGDKIQLRAQYGGTELDGGYLEVPEITVDEPITEQRIPGSTFFKYVEEAWIPDALFGAQDTWEEIDISPYMCDTSAIGVTLRATAWTAPIVGYFGARTPGATFPYRERSVGYVDFIVYFGSSGNNIEVSWSGGIPINHTLTITGEVHEHAAFHDDPIYHNLTEPWSTWNDIQVTPVGGDAVSDIAAVIVAVRSDDGRFGLRQKGDMRGDLGLRKEGSHHWYVCGLDSNGYYQVYTTGKTGPLATPYCRFYETGYVLKTGGIVTLEGLTGMGLAEQAGSYAPIDFSGEVASEAFVVGGHWNHPSPNSGASKAYLRAAGSASAPSGLAIAQAEQNIGNWVGLDVDLKAEYRTGTRTTPIDFFVEWYEELLLPQIPPVLGLAKGTAEAHAAVAGMAEAHAAVAGMAEAHAAVAGTAEASAVRKA